MSSILNKKIGKLLVILEYKKKGTIWADCICDCGNMYSGNMYAIKNGLVSSCGCLYRLNLVGQKIGKLFVVSYYGIVSKHTAFNCQCDCGNNRVVVGHLLKSRRVTCCGCDNGHQKLKVRHLDPVLYGTWKGMRARCHNPKNISYKNYGGRGITICKEWDDFKVFYNWAINNGYKHRLQLDRVNNDGNYEPSNCQFISQKENTRKSRQSKLNYNIANEIRESNLPMIELAIKYNVSVTTIRNVKNNKTWAN